MSLKDESHPEGLQPGPAKHVGTQPPAATAHGGCSPPSTFPETLEGD